MDAKTLDGRFWNREVERILKRKQPARQVHSPYILQMLLTDGERYEVKVWGLPIHSRQEREKRRCRELKAERTAGKTWSQGRLPMQMVNEEDHDGPVFGDSNSKSYRRQQWAVDEDDEAKTVRKRESRAVEARNEAARQKSEMRKASKERIKAAAEVQAAKKVAQKRLGKRVE